MGSVDGKVPDIQATFHRNSVGTPNKHALPRLAGSELLAALIEMRRPTLVFNLSCRVQPKDKSPPTDQGFREHLVEGSGEE